MRRMVSRVLERDRGRDVVGLVGRYGGERGRVRGGLGVLLMEHGGLHGDRRIWRKTGSMGCTRGERRVGVVIGLGGGV